MGKINEQIDIIIKEEQENENLEKQKETIKILLNEENLIVAYEEIDDLENSIVIEDDKIINRIKNEGLLDVNDNFQFKYQDEKLSKKRVTKEIVEEYLNPSDKKITELESRIERLEGEYK